MSSDTSTMAFDRKSSLHSQGNFQDCCLQITWRIHSTRKYFSPEKAKVSWHACWNQASSKQNREECEIKFTFLFPPFFSEQPKHGDNIFEWHHEWTKKLGKMWAYSFFGNPNPEVHITEPKVIQHILSTKFDNYVKVQCLFFF